MITVLVECSVFAAFFAFSISYLFSHSRQDVVQHVTESNIKPMEIVKRKNWLSTGWGAWAWWSDWLPPHEDAGCASEDSHNKTDPL